jgi:hypothetical protein
MGILQGLISDSSRLYALWKGEPDDDRIFFSSWDGKDNWAPQVTIGGNTSAGPALAVSSGSVYAAWKGEWSDPRLFFAKLNGSAWGPQAQIPGAFSDVGPALGALGGKLIAAWKNAFDQGLYYASYDGTKWSAQAQIPGVGSSVGPALAPFGTKLYAAWKGESTDQGIYYASYDGTKWSTQAQIPGVGSSVGPALAASGTKLYAVWKGEGTDQGLYYASYDGTKWSAQAQIPGVASSIGAALSEFNGKLYAMWKGAGADVSLYNAFYDGTKWSAQSRNVPGNTGPDPVQAPVPAPGPGLGSNSNYIFYDNGKTLTNVSVTIQITEDLVSSNGFGFQLNAYSPNPTENTCDFQQFGVAVASNALLAFINTWSEKNGILSNENPWPTLQSLQSNKLAAGYQLTITLQNDAKTGNVTGCTFNVVDNNGVAQPGLTLSLLSLPHATTKVTQADLAPIVAFELDLVGPFNSEHASLTSGQGTLTLSATNDLTALTSEPAGLWAGGTAETANSFYSSLPVSYPNGEFWQLFSTSTIKPEIAKKGLHVLPKPSGVE